MLILQSIILGIIQGVTEWLPVSSSGHLVLLQSLFQLNAPIAFDVLLHVATLLVILIYFRQDIWNISKAFLKWQTGTQEFKLGAYIIIASIPTAIIYFLFKGFIEAYFSNLLALSISFFVTGLLLLSTRAAKKNESNINLTKSLLVGTAQGIAIMPGISRSGSTISTALLSGIKREEAFRFSFLLAIPAILGATIVKYNELAQTFEQTMIAGFIASFLVGYASLIFMSRIIKKGELHKFSYYCFLMAILTLIIKIFMLK